MSAQAGPRAGGLRLAGSVAFEVDGSRGTATGDGDVLRVTADDPAAAWDAVAGSVPTGVLGRLADALHREGLAVEVSGLDGVLATVGAGADSAVGRAVTGSRRVQPGRPAALRPLVVARLTRTVTVRRRALLLGLLAAALVAVRRRARAH
jgi:hypothetical protein